MTSQCSRAFRLCLITSARYVCYVLPRIHRLDCLGPLPPYAPEAFMQHTQLPAWDLQLCSLALGPISLKQLADDTHFTSVFWSKGSSTHTKLWSTNRAAWQTVGCRTLFCKPGAGAEPHDTLKEWKPKIPRGAKKHPKAFLFPKIRDALTSDAPILSKTFWQLLFSFFPFRIRPRLANIMGKNAVYDAKHAKNKK